MQLAEGLYVMLFGMGLVFLALTLIMVTMIVLDRLFRMQAPAAVAAAGELPVSAGVGAPPAGREAEIALAITLAVARARGEGRRLPSGEQAATRWDWVWDEGLDDYGLTKGSAHGSIPSNN